MSYFYWLLVYMRDKRAGLPGLWAGLCDDAPTKRPSKFASGAPGGPLAG